MLNSRSCARGESSLPASYTTDHREEARRWGEGGHPAKIHPTCVSASKLGLKELLTVQRYNGRHPQADLLPAEQKIAESRQEDGERDDILPNSTPIPDPATKL